MESIRSNLEWRLAVLRPHLTRRPFSNYRVLPRPDPFGRPIIQFKVSALNDISETLKDLLIHTMDNLRARLRSINDNRSRDGDTSPILQYVVLLDLSGLSIQMIVR